MIKLTRVEGPILVNPSYIIDIHETTRSKHKPYTEISLPNFALIVLENDVDILAKLPGITFLKFTLVDETSIHVAENHIVNIWPAHGDDQAAIQTVRDTYIVLNSLVDAADRLGVSL